MGFRQSLLINSHPYTEWCRKQTAYKAGVSIPSLPVISLLKIEQPDCWSLSGTGKFKKRERHVRWKASVLGQSIWQSQDRSQWGFEARHSALVGFTRILFRNVTAHIHCFLAKKMKGRSVLLFRCFDLIQKWYQRHVTEATAEGIFLTENKKWGCYKDYKGNGTEVSEL